MKSLHDYIAEVESKDEVVPNNAPPVRKPLKTKKKSNPYYEPNHAMSHDAESNGGRPK